MLKALQFIFLDLHISILIIYINKSNLKYYLNCIYSDIL